MWLSVPEKEKVLEGMAEMPKAAYRVSQLLHTAIVVLM